MKQVSLRVQNDDSGTRNSIFMTVGGAVYGISHPETVIERVSGAKDGYLHPVWLRAGALRP